MTDDPTGHPPAGHPPAGLDGHLVHREPHPLRHALTGLLLALTAGGAVWAAFVGAGPARLDAAALGESVDARSSGLTAAAVVLTEVGSTVVMGVLAALVAL